jgi:hypothetical protein
VDRHTRYCVGLFVHGVLPRSEHKLAVEKENKRLKRSIADALDNLERVRERLNQTGPE